MNHKFDVAIMGGGLGGNMLARQLRRSCPNLSVAVFERSREPSRKVGESTVEISSNYLTRRLGLSTYLYTEHLPKNGLRFFFDNAARDAELPSMAEIGSRGFPLTPSFQLDRARLERDLAAFNRADGVAMFPGTRVRNLNLGDGGQGALHTFSAECDGQTATVRARWVIDASGRASLVAKLKGLRVNDVGHETAAAWGRMQGVADIDALSTPVAWRERVRHTSRRLSTNHFCYPGYWIWLIPLREGITSVGVVCTRNKWRDELRKPEGLLAFIREHRGVGSLLKDASWLDVGSYGRLAYTTKQYFSRQRWAVIGDAASFTDPFYSPGIDFLALENDFVCDLIARDFAGEIEAFEQRLPLYDEFMAFRYEAVLRLYRDLYPTLGSYELFRLKFDFDLRCYYNLWLDMYMRDDHLRPKALADQLRRKEYILQAISNFAGLFRKLAHELHSAGRFFTGNTGSTADHYDHSLESLAFIEKIGTQRTRRSITRSTLEIFSDVHQRALDLLSQTESTPTVRKPLAFDEFVADAPLA
ncbi:MAG: NAD(P)/FAD-dependent oxidoreductase [Nannocystaceae bacterium]